MGKDSKIENDVGMEKAAKMESDGGIEKTGKMKSDEEIESGGEMEKKAGKMECDGRIERNVGMGEDGGIKSDSGMKKNRLGQGFTAWLLAAMVLALTLCFFLIPGKTFSENENRTLARFPALSAENVRSGQFMTDLSTYLADHFPFRDFFMGFKTQAELLEGRREISGVYIAKDGYLIERYEKPVNTEKIGEILHTFAGKIDAIRTEDGRSLNLRLMLVPTASCILADLLPEYAPADGYGQQDTIRQLRELSGIPFIDCSDLLRKAGENGQIYYRLDHHWTTYGAYAGYLAVCQELGLEAVPLSGFDAQVVTADFKGTVYSKANVYTAPGDTITLYTNPADRLTVNYVDTGEVSDSLYNLNYLHQKDKYSLFLDNLHSLIEITNETAESERELVLLKDSYANCMVPFLTHHFRKIYVFDTRSYRLGPSGFIGEHPDVTDVLILYNMNTLDSDLGIRAIY